MAEYYSIVCAYISFILSSVCGHLGCDQVLAIAGSAAVNTGCMHPFKLQFPPSLPRSGIAGSDGNHFLRNLHTPPAVQETWVQCLGWEDLLEKGMSTHSSIIAWRIPETEEPGGLQSRGHRELDTT